MKQYVSEGMFIDAFRDMNREDNFSIAGRRALYQSISDYEEGTGEDTELDIIALCVEYSEYDSAYDAMKEYQPDDMPVEGEAGDDLLEVQEKNEKAAREWLENRTTVIDVDGGGVIIQQF